MSCYAPYESWWAGLDYIRPTVQMCLSPRSRRSLFVR